MKIIFDRIKFVLTISLLMLLFGCSNNADKPVGKQIALRLTPQPGNPRNSEGDFIKLNDGRILFIYTHFTDGAGDNAKAYLAGRFSSDNGKTWSDKDVTILPNEGGMNVMSVSLLRLEDGNIALFYLRKNSEVDCTPYMRTSSDEAKTWSDPVKMIDIPGYYVGNNDRVVILNSGRLIIPVSMHNTPEIKTGFNGRIMCYYSDDNGKSWQKSREAANPTNVTSQEPGLVQLESGQLMLWCRTNAGVQYITFSNDDGETWSPLEPGNIKSPLSPASIERIPTTGDLLLLWNNNYKEIRDGGKRTPFNIAISKDDGKSWQKIKMVESDPSGWYCYTAIEFVDDHVLLGHCAGDTRRYGGLETTQITRLSLDWIYQEATPDPFVKVDKAGTIELDCNGDVTIRYTLNGTLPSPTTGQIYKSPIIVSRTTQLLMQAFQADNPPSQIISAYVGSDVLQNAQNIQFEPGPGLIYSYYEGEIYRSVEIDKVPFVRSGISPQFTLEKSERDRNYGLIFKGYIEIPKDGSYTFFVESNDGSVMYLDDSKFIDNDGPHGVYEMSASTTLQKGKHSIELKYFQMRGGQALIVSWQGPGFEKTEIPTDVLFHAENR